MAKARRGIYQDPVTNNWTVIKRIPKDLRVHFCGSYNLKKSTGTSLRSEAEPLVLLIKSDFARRIQVARLASQVSRAEYRRHVAGCIAQRWFMQEFPIERRRTTAQHILDYETPDSFDPRVRIPDLGDDDDRAHQFYRGEALRQSVTAFAGDADVPPDVLVDEAVMINGEHYELPQDVMQSKTVPQGVPVIALEEANHRIHHGA